MPYGYNDPAAIAAINAMANKNNAAAAAKPYVQTTGTQQQAQATAAKAKMLSQGASYFPSANPTAQMKSSTAGMNKTVTNQSSSNDAAKKAMLAFGGQYMQPGAQVTGSSAQQFQTNTNNLIRDLGLGTKTGSLWDAYEYTQNRPQSSGGGSSGAGAALGGALGGGGMGSMGGMMGGLGGLGGMMGGGGMGGIGDALGGALGGGGGSATAAEEEKEPEKPAPQRYWAGGYTDRQIQAMNEASTLTQEAELKAAYDRDNIERFKGLQSYDETKKDRVRNAQELAQRQGGQYDSEGNYYARSVIDDLVKEENEKRSKQDANRYDTPDGAVPIAGNPTDNTPKTPAASGGTTTPSTGSGGSGTGSNTTKDPKKKTDWGSFFSGIFGGR